MNGLSLFSGIGGLDVALSDWVRPIAYCEIDPYCQAVLLSRMGDNSITEAPIWDDIKSFPWNPFIGNVDIIYGGFPCPDISIAGTGKGLEGKRSGLFYEIIRLCSEIKPRFIFLENVPAITTRGGTEVVRQITSLGYDCRWCIISAASVGALHKRERWFCLAYSRSNRLETQGLSFRQEKEKSQPKLHVEYKVKNKWPKDKSPLLGVDDVIPYWMDRVKCLGNSVHVEQTKEAFKELIGIA